MSNDGKMTPLEKQASAVFVACFKNFGGIQKAFADRLKTTRGYTCHCLNGRRVPSWQMLERAGKVGGLVVVVGYELALKRKGKASCAKR
jgi:hypothetical protein